MICKPGEHLYTEIIRIDNDRETMHCKNCQTVLLRYKGDNEAVQKIEQWLYNRQQNSMITRQQGYDEV